MPMLIKEAIEIAHTLSNPSKMPGKATSLPISACITGSKLREDPNSVCFGCYAGEGSYLWENTKIAMDKRLAGLLNPNWVPAMIKLVWNQESFRWFDSGDLQSVKHLANIVAVCEGTPHVDHWLPTKEHGIVDVWRKRGGVIPSNLVIRLSAHMRNKILDSDLPTSMVYEGGIVPEGVTKCSAYSGETATCGDCRACWDPKVAVVGYPYHQKGRLK